MTIVTLLITLLTKPHDPPSSGLMLRMDVPLNPKP